MSDLLNNPCNLIITYIIGKLQPNVNLMVWMIDMN